MIENRMVVDSEWDEDDETIEEKEEQESLDADERFDRWRDDGGSYYE